MCVSSWRDASNALVFKNRCSWPGNKLSFKEQHAKHWWCQLSYSVVRGHTEKKKKFFSTPPVPQNCSHGVPLPQRSCSVLTINSCQFPKACLSPRHVWSCLVAGQAHSQPATFCAGELCSTRRAVCPENSPANSCGAAMWKECTVPFSFLSQTAPDCSAPSVTCLHAPRTSNGQAGSPFRASHYQTGLGRTLQVIWRCFFLMHWISSLASIIHIYLSDPSHCEGWDHTAQCHNTPKPWQLPAGQREHIFYLVLWPKSRITSNTFHLITRHS